VGGEEFASRLTLQAATGGGPADQVRMTVRNAPPVAVTLRRPVAGGLTPQSLARRSWPPRVAGIL
jgi:hypothetical protein